MFDRSLVTGPRLLAAAAASLLLLVGASTASALAPRWRLESRSAPTYLKAGEKEARLVVTATNVGDAEVSGTLAHPVTLTDKLPAGLAVPATLTSENVFADLFGATGGKTLDVRLPCTLAVNHKEVTCTTTESTRPIAPYNGAVLTVPVENVSLKEGEENTVDISGGQAVECHEVAPGAGKFTDSLCKVGGAGNFEKALGGVVAETAPLSRPLLVGEETPFGAEQYELTPEEEGGSPDTQAGSHPFALTTTLNLNQTIDSYNGGTERLISAPALLKNLQVKLPPGLIGDPNAVPQCASVDFGTILTGDVNTCEPDTAVGVAVVNFNEPNQFRVQTIQVPVFNLTPAPGEPARFGFEAAKVAAVLDTSVLSEDEYAVQVSVSNASQAAQILGSQVTVWGVPGDARHDRSRGWACLAGHFQNPEQICELPSARSTKAFLTLPTSCTGSLPTSAEVQSWVPGAGFLAAPLSHPFEALGGCQALPFGPSIKVEPESQESSTPTGLRVDVHLPQQTTQEAEGLAEAAVKDSTVVLPQGVQLSPSAANGLEACTEEQVGFKSLNPTTRAAEFTAAPASCPQASKVGIVHISTPDLPHELEGGVYLAAQSANPFGSLFAMYIIAEEPVSRVRVKLAGEVKLDETTGKVTTTFTHTPQVPFEDLKLELFGGPRASVTTPALCGTYTTTTSFTPWSGTEPQSPFGAFNIGSGAGGSGCANPLPLAAGFQAGMASTQAGGYGQFELTINRPDGDQALTGVSMHLPTGLAAMLSSVTLCPEPQAAQGTCGPESLIGHATATAGLGSEPFTETGGQVFITGPYQGAPFGLSVVIPTKAGPFNFGNVVTRSTLSVDRNNASVTINSPLPTMVNTVTTNTGVPVQLKQVHVVVDRPNFQFNPTNCSPLKIDGTLTGAQGASQSVSSSFQAANCAALPFKPTFAASTEAKTSKANGASLKVRVTSGPGQANIGKTNLELPIALPSRLTTIQKACLAATFAANPASCPEGSNIGTATVHTPVLKSALTGPAYLVSHGNAKFPDVEFVLQGEGITLVLDGETDIKKGITHSNFNSLPDAPVSTFETTLPEGPHSALAANGNLCAQPLFIPTTLTGQNGAIVKQQTKVTVTGCPKGLTAKQKLEKAMRACKKLKKKSRRNACEARARKAYKAAVKAAVKHKKH
jgi:hypothetical protein